MKYYKKVCVLLLIGVFCFSSVALSYEKANTCKAAEVGLGIGIAVLTTAILISGAYAVSSPEAKEEMKETFTNYKNLSVEGAKNAYELNKKLFNDFCTYAQSNGGGSASVYTASGQSYSVDQMQAEGFPDFSKWDDEMKKQSEKPKGSLWDALSFGLDLITFVSSFFKDNPTVVLPDESRKQYYFTGDDGYINRETGDAFIYLYSDLGVYRRSDNYYPDTYYRLEHIKNYGENTTFRAAIFLVPDKVSGDSLKYDLPGGNVDYKWYRYKVDARALCGYDGSTRTDYLSNITGGFIQYNRSQGNVERVDATGSGYFRSSYSCRFSDPHDASSYVVTEWDFLSTNVPIFLTQEEAKNYITTGDYSGCLNLPPALETPTPKPDNPESSPLDIYLNHYRSGGYTVGSVVNTNYNIGNNWDGSTSNLIYILSGENYDPTPVNTITPKPTLAENDEGGNNTIYNFYINIENAINNVFNFFVIDVGDITASLSLDNPGVVSKFQLIWEPINYLKGKFPEDTYDPKTGILIADYPKITVGCPALFQDFIFNTDEDGKQIVKTVLEDGATKIVLVDFREMAIYLVRFRMFLKAAIWIGMVFYLLKELSVTFNIS